MKAPSDRSFFFWDSFTMKAHTIIEEGVSIMEAEVILFGKDTQSSCEEILRRSLPQYSVKKSGKLPGEFILLRGGKAEEYWCIFDGKQEDVRKMAGENHLRTLTCGFSTYDSLVLSSCNAEQALVSLLREIHTVFDASVEPGDYLIYHRSEVPEEALLLCTGVLLLAGTKEREFHF